VPATAIIIFAHGSSVESANEAVRLVAANVRNDGGFEMVETAFLDQGRPDLASAVASVVAQGATRIVVVPYFLTLGIHLQRDLPNIVSGLARIHKGVEIYVAPPLDGHPALSEILKERVREVLENPR
jgi:sirohydrochlorin ferrochelatase